MTKSKKFPFPLKIVCIALAFLIALIGLVLLGARAYFRLSVSDYYQASEKGFVIPALGDGFVPQGLDYDERSNQFFVTGYMDDGRASPIYLVKNDDDSSYKTLRLAEADGTPFTGHAGGLTVHGDYVYVAGGGDCCLYVYSYAEMLSAEDGASVSCLGEFSLGTKEDGIRVSFTASDEAYLYAGEFYRAGNYETAESHKLTTKAGDRQQALAVAYAFSDGEDAIFGLSATPTVAYSLPDQVQGMCFTEDQIYLSTSYGVAFSNLYEYDRTKLILQKELELLGTTLPLYALDSAAQTACFRIAPMSEEIEFVDGKLYVMCESASNKYIFGKFTSAKWCYATDVEKMKSGD